MKRTIKAGRRRGALLTAIVMLAVALGQMLVTAPTASASSYCPASDYVDSSQPAAKSIDLPNKTDVTIQPTLCLYDETGFYQSVMVLRWWVSGGGAHCCGTKFNNFAITTWVQKNDFNKCSETDYPGIYGSSSGSLTISCTWQSANTSGVSSDGRIVYDVADDGKEPFTWQLNGTGPST